jgi:dGTPase
MEIMDAECRNDLEPVMMSEEMNQAMFDLREFMFENLYTNPYAKGEEVKAQRMLTELYNYYLDRVELLPAQYINMIEQEHEDVDRVVCDYIAGMTDQYAINKFNEVFMPMSWMIVED